MESSGRHPSSESGEPVGVDRVLRVGSSGDGLRVVARREMPEWKVERYRPVLVEYRGARYRVTHREVQGPRRHVYTLEPWIDDGATRPAAVIAYDAAAVERREAIARATRRSGLAAFATWPLRPLLGLLPAGAKLWLQPRIGIDPETVTRQSIRLEQTLGIAAAALGLVHTVTGGQLTPELGPALWIAGLLWLDVALRWNRIEEGGAEQPGFGQWGLARRGRGSR